MNKRKKRILFVQIENFHGEVLGPQLELLEREYDLFLFGSSELIKEDLVSVYNVESYNISTFGLFKFSVFIKKAVSVILYVLNLIKLKLLIKRIHADLVIFNTITVISKAILIGIMFKKNKKVLVVHNAEDYLEKNMLFDFYEKILFLSEEVYNYCVLRTNRKYRKKLEYFIPVCFDRYKERIGIKAYPNLDNRIILGIIGKTDATKRDYTGLLKTLEEFKDEDQRFHVVISGAVTKDFVKEVERSGLDLLISFEPGYQPFSILFSDIINSDILLFLINKNVRFFDKYNKVKISGTMNMAKAFCKPVAYSRDFNAGEYLSETGIPYNTLEEFLDRIQSGEITKESIAVMQDKKRCEEYKRSQAEHYREIIRTLLSL